MFKSAFAMVAKDTKLSLRKPLFIIISILVPLIFVSFYALVIHTSSTNPIVIAQHSEGPYSEQFVDVLNEMESIDGPYLEIKTLDPQSAYEKYESGKAAALLEIPGTFDDSLSSGKEAVVHLHMFNINSDATKNCQLRLDHALYQFQRDMNSDQSITIQETTVLNKDIPMKRYIGTGLLVFSILLTAMVNTGTLMAREWEEKTAKSIVLTPKGTMPFIMGKWISAFIMTFVSTFLVLILLYTILDYPVAQLRGLSWLYLFLFFLYGSGVGALLGVLFQKSLPIVPISVVIGMAEFLVSSLESYIRGFAHGGMTEWVWWIGSWWPSSELIDNIRFTVEAFTVDSMSWGAFTFMVLWIVLITTLAWIKLTKALTFTQGQ